MRRWYKSFITEYTLNNRERKYRFSFSFWLKLWKQKYDALTRDAQVDKVGMFFYDLQTAVVRDVRLYTLLHVIAKWNNEWCEMESNFPTPGCRQFAFAFFCFFFG